MNIQNDKSRRKLEKISWEHGKHFIIFNLVSCFLQSLHPFLCSLFLYPTHSNAPHMPKRGSRQIIVSRDLQFQGNKRYHPRKKWWERRMCFPFGRPKAYIGIFSGGRCGSFVGKVFFWYLNFHGRSRQDVIKKKVNGHNESYYREKTTDMLFTQHLVGAGNLGLQFSNRSIWYCTETSKVSQYELWVPKYDTLILRFHETLYVNDTISGESCQRRETLG